MSDTGDMAAGFGTVNTNKKSVKPDAEFNGCACFNLDGEDEYHSFSRGIKTFHRWTKHTKSESVRQWAKENKGKPFYITHNGSYTKVKR